MNQPSMKALAAAHGLSDKTLADRLKRGVPMEQALRDRPLSASACGRRNRNSPWRRGFAVPKA